MRLNKTYRSILLMLIVPVIGGLIGWATWVTAQTYSSQQTKQELVQYRAYTTEQQQELRADLHDFQKEVRENHQTLYKTLLSMQKQVSEISKKN